MPRSTFSFVATVIFIAAAAICHAAGATDSITVLPTEFQLSGPAARQTLLVQETRDGKLFGQLGKDVTLTSSDEKIVKIDHGAAVPVANGSAVITATSPAGSATTKVTVAAMDKPFDCSFRNHVQPVLEQPNFASTGWT